MSHATSHQRQRSRPGRQSTGVACCRVRGRLHFLPSGLATVAPAGTWLHAGAAGMEPSAEVRLGLVPLNRLAGRFSARPAAGAPRAGCPYTGQEQRQFSSVAEAASAAVTRRRLPANARHSKKPPEPTVKHCEHPPARRRHNRTRRYARMTPRIVRDADAAGFGEELCMA